LNCKLKVGRVEHGHDQRSSRIAVVFEDFRLEESREKNRSD
jgi:hypothetical protein